MLKNKKSLGQHWLKDRFILDYIADEADLNKEDVVLEIGPGLGTLTSSLLKRAGKVIAVEYDENLAKNLPKQFPGKNLEVINIDFLKYDLDKLDVGYKVVANVPYYITSKIVEKLLVANNKPKKIVLLVQKEVALRMAEKPGNLSVLAIASQSYAKVTLGDAVGKELFTPPPEVDSQVVILDLYDKPIFADYLTEAEYMLPVKRAFLNKRKKLISSLNGLVGDKTKTKSWLESLDIDENKRAEDLFLDEWLKIAKSLKEKDN
mgnify:FL=1